MHRRDLSILLLLVVVITAPIVDALACDDCKDSIPLRDMRKCSTDGLHQSDDSILSSDACCPAQQETGVTGPVPALLPKRHCHDIIGVRRSGYH